MDGAGSQLGEGDGFISKFDPDAADGERLLWTRHVGTDEAEEVRNLSIVDGVLYASGHTWGALEGFENAGLADVFVAALDLDGELIDAAQFGTEGQERAFLDVGEDRICLTGFTEGSMTGPNAGFVDAYVLPLDLQLQVVPEPALAAAVLLTPVLLLRRPAGTARR